MMQYLTQDTDEDDGSMVSPTSSADSMHQNLGVQQQQQQMLQAQQRQNQNGIFQPRRFPESPAMTDPCGNVSSSSSSSHHSDPMFSPNEFNGYAGANDNGNQTMNNIQSQQLSQQQHQQTRGGNLMMPQQSSIHAQMQNMNAPQFWSQPGTAAVNQPTNTLAQLNLFNIIRGGADSGMPSPVLEMPRKRSRLDTPCETPRIAPSFAGIDGFPDENYSQQQAIRFSKFQEEQWSPLYDINAQPLQQLQVHVVADKGFNYNSNDNCFVNQKKNHFQISVNVEASDTMPPKYVNFNNRLVPIRDFKLSFCGVKAEMPSSEITIRQSRADRKPHTHTPVLFEIQERRMTKVCVPRLHFSETTLNNQRKQKNRPNPEQKFFLLVVRLFASIDESEHGVLIQSYASEKVIVRATNPGSFEPQDTDIGWQRNGGALYTQGAVSVGTEHQVESAKLTVAGDIYMSGRIINPSDIRLKEAITERETAEAIENLLKLRVVDYRYKPEVADIWGLDEQQRHRTGLIAQELQAVLPDAVRDIGDYLTIDEGRVFYETVMATQQLCRMTGDLDSKIDEKVAEISRRLNEYAVRKKLASSMASNLNGDNKSLSYSRCSLTSTATNATSQPKRSRKHRAIKQAQSCGSRLSQGTVVTLVSIMAACLLAMSALYVLDWHNRNYGYHQHFETNTPSTKGELANLVISPANFMPSFQPDAPILLEKCFNPSCKTYCCTDTPPVVEDSRAIATHGLDNGDEVYPESPSNRTNGIARAPNLEHMAFETGVEIRIPALNVTLDQRYCVERSCNKRKGIFNVFVPVSRYMPDVALEIEIKAPISKVVSNCGAFPSTEFNHKVCPLSRTQQSESPVPTSTRLFDNIFELSMGSFIQSAYRFRVGYSTETCFSEDSNGSYEEYNLIFYRMCTLSSS